MTLDLKFSINVKRRFVVNGREYSSLDEMPEADRKVYEKAMNALKTDASHPVELQPPAPPTPETRSLPASDTEFSFPLGKTLFVLLVLIVGLLAYLWVKTH